VNDADPDAPDAAGVSGSVNDVGRVGVVDAGEDATEGDPMLVRADRRYEPIGWATSAKGGVIGQTKRQLTRVRRRVPPRRSSIRSRASMTSPISSSGTDPKPTNSPPGALVNR
jgi:hypothetical protein